MSISSLGETPTEMAKHRGSPSTLTPPTLTPAQKRQNWLLLLVYCALTALGCVGAPLLQRLYYTHGGSLKWFQTGLLSGGCLVLIPPLVVLYFKTKLPTKLFFMDITLFYCSVGMGILNGLCGYLGTFGLSRIPVSTSCLISSAQLAFTAVFALILVRQKFTFYSTNAVVAISLGAIVLALHSSSDRPSGVTEGEYLAGFFFTLAGAALGGLCMPLYQLVYSKSRRPPTYIIMMQVVTVGNLAAATFALVGMLVNKEFQALRKDAKGFSLGLKSYCLIAIASGVISQLTILGSVGIVSCKSSLFAGIYTSTLLPITQAASIIVFHEKFTGEKALSLVLCLWGFTSYFFGEFKMIKKIKHIAENTSEHMLMDRQNDLESTTQIEMSGHGEKTKVQDV